MLAFYRQDRADADDSAGDGGVFLEVDDLEVGDQIRHVLICHRVPGHGRLEVVAARIDAPGDRANEGCFVERFVAALRVLVAPGVRQCGPVDGRTDDADAAAALTVTLHTGENRRRHGRFRGTDRRPDDAIALGLTGGVDELAAGLGIRELGCEDRLRGERCCAGGKQQGGFDNSLRHRRVHAISRPHLPR